MKTVCIIPARFNSTRFNGKVVAKLGGKSVIEHVYNAAKEVVDDVYVATNDSRVANVVGSFGGKSLITHQEHVNGTSRVKEALYHLLRTHGRQYDICINLQGDEPLINPEDIRRVKKYMENLIKEDESNTVVTLATTDIIPIDFLNRNIVKVSCNEMTHEASRFTRDQAVASDLRHVGIYATSVENFLSLPIEDRDLEQNVWMDAKIDIHVLRTYHSSISIDTPSDLERAERRINKTKSTPVHFTLMAGPCVVESKEMISTIAEKLDGITKRLGIKLIFKASYVKANRTHLDSFATLGIVQALTILKDLKNTYPDIPVITDVHSPSEVPLIAPYVDMLQIPAFLCRQTELLINAGRTMKPINVKKGQFLSGEMMKFVAQKIESTGNTNIMLTERGTTFGYQDLIVDFRNIPIMQTTGYPVFVDITHSLQKPNQACGVSGGDPSMIELIGKCAIASGANGIFLETHPNPSEALSDGQSMLKLDLVEPLLEKLIRLKQAL